jgi:AcrR family transcriptional regulator
MKRMTAALRREQIITVSKQLFSKRGFSGTTTKEIAKASGISEAMIFRHFASKQELYSAIIDQRIREVGDLIPDGAIEEKDDERVFSSIARSVLEKTEQDPTMMRLLYFSALEGHELSDIFYSSHEIKRVTKLVEYIKLRTQEGVFRNLDPVLVARAFFGMLYGYVTARHLFSAEKFFPKATTESAVNSFLKIFLDGLRSPKKLN